MKRSSLLLTILVFLGSCASSSNEEALFKIADDVVKTTMFELHDTITTPPLMSQYNLWLYPNFMILEGMDALGKVTGIQEYSTYAQRNIDFFAEYQSRFGPDLDKHNDQKGPRRWWYARPSEMHYSGMIAAFPERYMSNPLEEFNRGMAYFDEFLEKAPRLNDGTLVRNKREELGRAVQIDDLYMVAPYWCRKSSLLNDSTWLNLAIKEALSHHRYLWDEDKNLMHCLWLENEQKPYGLFWGRGNGWYIMALTDILTFIPKEHPMRSKLLENYRSFINGIVRMQDKDGLWHQLLDRQDSYAETSCSGMFTYCILKGVNEGWLESSFLEIGNRGWKGLLSMVDENFNIEGVCPPVDISEDPQYYMNKGPVIHDMHAIGPFLLSGAEYIRANEKY